MQTHYTILGTLKNNFSYFIGALHSTVGSVSQWVENFVFLGRELYLKIGVKSYFPEVGKFKLRDIGKN